MSQQLSRKTKLTEATVRAILADKNSKATEMAAKHGVSRQTIQKIFTREIWKHVQ